MADILQTTFWNAFSGRKLCLCLDSYFTGFLGVQFSIMSNPSINGTPSPESFYQDLWRHLKSLCHNDLSVIMTCSVFQCLSSYSNREWVIWCSKFACILMKIYTHYACCAFILIDINYLSGWYENRMTLWINNPIKSYPSHHFWTTY